MTNTPRTAFKFSNAAFLVFNREYQFGSFVWKSACLYAFIMMGLMFFVGPMMIDVIRDFVVIIQEIEKNPEDETLAFKMFGLMGKIVLPYLIVMIIGWMVWATIETAIHRRVLRNEDLVRFPWRFGKDELRTILCQLVLFVVYQVAYYVVYIGIAVVAMLTVLMASQSTALGIVGGIISFVLGVAGIGAMCFILSRLAPAAALSTADDKISISESWPVVKGRFWPAFGTYALHYIVMMVVFYAIMIAIALAIFSSSFAEVIETANTGSGDEVWANIKQLLSPPSTKLSLTIFGFLFFFMICIWMQCIAGVSTYLTHLYKEDLGVTGAYVFD